MVTESTARLRVSGQKTVGLERAAGRPDAGETRAAAPTARRQVWCQDDPLHIAGQVYEICRQ